MLSERQNELLEQIVLEYVKTTKPVGSNHLCERLKVSSATIRNDMAILEELGFLEKNHISSGRIPSEKGYRYYVDHLMEPKKLNGEEMLKLQTIFHNHTLKISDVIQESMAIISEMTNYTTVVLGKASSTNCLKQVEVVPIDDLHLIALLVTDKGHVEHKDIFFTEQYDLTAMRQIVSLINKMLIGTPINEISNKLEFEIKPIIGGYVKQHEMLYDAFYQAFNDFKDNTVIQVKGKNKFLNQPEFSNIDKIKCLIDKLDDPEFISNIKEEDNEIKCYIGHESQIDDDVAVIKTKYIVGGEEGTIAIIGPKRMHYEKAVTFLDYIKRNIEVKNE